MLVDDAIKEIENKREMVLSWWSDEAVAKSLKAKFLQFADSNYTPSLYWENPYWKGIFITLNHIKGMKDLKPIFQFLGRHGYIHSGKPELYEKFKKVTWNFGNIKLLVFFDDSEDSNCRFVKLGTKVVDDIKLICPEMEKEE